MDVRCDRCQTEYELDDDSVSDTGTSVQCTTCGHQFVVKRPPAGSHSAVTPPGGHAKVPEPEPGVPPYTLSTDDGKVHRFRDLNTLQKWIVERKASRSDRLSRDGGPWLALGDMDELAAFFRVVDEADRARGPGPGRGPGAKAGTPPPRHRTSSAPYGTAARTPAGAAGTPPPVPYDARKTVQPDGPTVPNRRLPDANSEVTPTRPPRRTPGLGLPPTGGAAAASNPNTALTTPVMPAVTSTAIPKAAPASGSKPHGGTPRPAANAPSRPNQLPLDRPHATNEFMFGDPTGASDADLLVPRHRGRNAAIVVLLLAGLGGGGAYYWRTQMSHPEAAPSPVAAEPTPAAAPAPAANAGPPVAAPAAPVAEATGGAAAAPVAEAPPAPAAKTTPVAEAKEAKEPKAAPAPKETPGKDGGKEPKDTGGKSIGARGKAATTGGRATAAAKGAPAPAGDGGGYDHLVTEGDRLLENGQAAKAEKLYAQALVAKPEGAGALTGLAYVQLEHQHHFKAIEMFRRVLSTQPTYGPALFGIAESYRARGDNTQALTAYRQYLTVSPSGADAPAARRQIKDLESASPQAAASSSGGAKKDQEDE